MTADIRSGLYRLGSNKSLKCPEWGSNPGPPDCDHWVTQPLTVTELFNVKLINRLIARIAAGSLVGYVSDAVMIVVM